MRATAPPPRREFRICGESPSRPPRAACAQVGMLVHQPAGEGELKRVTPLLRSGWIPPRVESGDAHLSGEAHLAFTLLITATPAPIAPRPVPRPRAAARPAHARAQP